MIGEFASRLLVAGRVAARELVQVCTTHLGRSLWPFDGEDTCQGW